MREGRYLFGCCGCGVLLGGWVRGLLIGDVGVGGWLRVVLNVCVLVFSLVLLVLLLLEFVSVNWVLLWELVGVLWWV